MRYISMFSGIEAASVAWHLDTKWGPSLGWEPVCFAEIEKFPCAVLAHHFPNVPNVGDMTTHDWSQYRGKVDLVCGGPPCQAFSIAGLRKGLEDPRGNLTLEFLSAVEKISPRWVIIENVPGMLSDDSKVLEIMLDALNELHYAVDIDILDAQCFGVPQRRRRVFLVCHSVEDGRKKKTPLFANDTSKFLTDTLLTLLAEVSSPSGIGAENLVWPKTYSRDGLLKKMRLFGMLDEQHQKCRICPDAFQNLLKDWEGALLKSQQDQENSESILENSNKGREGYGAILSEDAEKKQERQDGFSYIQKQWKSILEDLSSLLNESTTSTKTREIIESRIFIYAQASLNISRFMLKHSLCFPNSCDGDSCGLTALRGFTEYARQANDDLFRGHLCIHDWNDFIKPSEKLIIDLERSLGDRKCSKEIFFIGQGMSRNLEKGQQAAENSPADAGQGIAGSVSSKWAKGTGGPAGDECYNLTIANTLGTRNADGRNERGDGSGNLIPASIAHTLKGEGHDGSEDGAGRGVPLVAGTLGANHGNIKAEDAWGGKLLPIAMRTREGKDGGSKGPLLSEDRSLTRASGNDQTIFDMRGNGDGQTCPTLTKEASGDRPSDYAPMIHGGSCVRRLLPIECERLQGFPDDWTRIPYRGKSAEDCPDGPRYKSIGNSWAVPVARWVGERIAMVDLQDQED